MLEQYLPALVAIVVALGMCGLFLLLAIGLGPKRVTPQKLEPFECGSEPIGSPRVRFSVKFYQVAILFLVFDIESAFLYPWAVKYRELSTAPGGGVALVGLVELLIFLALLVVALIYVWRKKAIGWE
jgi:NADH-quinone oxidoreductase subunit A